jgi:hypothetical protein
MAIQAEVVQQIPEAEDLRTETRDMVLRARSYTVRSQDDDEAASEFLAGVVGMIKRIKEKFAEPKRKTHEAHRAVCDLEAELLAGPVQAEKIVKSEIGDYRLAEQRRRRDEQLKAEKEAREQEQKRRAAEVASLKDAGRDDEAASLAAQPIAPIIVAAQKPAASPVSTRAKWEFEIVAAELINRDFLAPDTTKIRQQVNALGSKAEQVVGGIRVFETLVPVVRGRS